MRHLRSKRWWASSTICRKTRNHSARELCRIALRLPSAAHPSRYSLPRSPLSFVRFNFRAWTITLSVLSALAARPAFFHATLMSPDFIPFRPFSSPKMNSWAVGLEPPRLASW